MIDEHKTRHHLSFSRMRTSADAGSEAMRLNVVGKRPTQIATVPASCALAAR
jgi:hypothetical protein